MTWRERIVEMRARGVSKGDLALASDSQTCAVSEYRAALDALGIRWCEDQTGNFTDLDRPTGFAEIAGWFPWAIKRGLLDEAEALLDKAEDRALQLKREQST